MIKFLKLKKKKSIGWELIRCSGDPAMEVFMGFAIGHTKQVSYGLATGSHKTLR